MTNTLQEKLHKIGNDFYGFWVTKWRVTFILMFVIIVLGVASVISIPKETQPDIEFGVISITTPYIGVNPIDIDQLITQKIESEVEDIEGIDTIESNSSLGLSSITLTLETDVETDDVLVDVNDAVDKANLPQDAEDTRVSVISASNTTMFQVLIYAPKQYYSREYIKQKAFEIQQALEGQGSITDITIQGGASYEWRVLIDQQSIESLGLSLGQLTSTIRSYNRNQPIGNFEIGDKTYDFRIQGEIEEANELANIPVRTQGGSVVRLGDIARIQKHYTDERATGFGSYAMSGFQVARLTVNKEEGASIFSAANDAKERFEEIMQREGFSSLEFIYTQDVSEELIDDYNSLVDNGLLTIFLVFVCLFFFVGFKESLIASITIPLAFCITFVVLQQLDLSLNFLTNFSLIVTFGIAIDVTIVIIEGAHEKMRLGFNPREAVLFAVRDYKLPLIAGTGTTLAAFLPMLSLPGVTGKFLAYIPITIFATLLAALFISLTINSALYYKLSRPKKYYISDKEEEEYMPTDEKEILEYQRKNKQEASSGAYRRDSFLITTSRFYENILRSSINTLAKRLLLVIIPFALLVVSFGLDVGFTFFPSGDSTNLSLTISAQEGRKQETLLPYIEQIENVLTKVEEIESYTYAVQDNAITVSIELLPKEERDARALEDSFTVETKLLDNMTPLTSQGLEVSSSVQAGGPPSSKPMGVKLIAQDVEKFDVLLDVAKDFEAYLIQMKGTRNVSLTSQDSPGQFVFSFDRQAVAQLGIDPQSIMQEIFARLQGIGAGSIRSNAQDYDITLLYADYVQGVSPSQVEDMIVATPQGDMRLGDIMSYEFTNAVSAIQREDTDVLIKAESDVEQGVRADEKQEAFVSYAESYDFPEGISFQVGGENAEQADVIQATGQAAIIAFILIYMILVLLFNSYRQPVIIMSSVAMGLLGANIGLFLTGNMYSMAFAIGFISLTGIVVNDAIVLIDKINSNRSKGMELMIAIVEAGKARLHPIILTTLTTILGLMSVVREDEFFAGLGYTIMFGIFVGSLATLFLVPSLYYMTARKS